MTTEGTILSSLDEVSDTLFSIEARRIDCLRPNDFAGGIDFSNLTACKQANSAHGRLSQIISRYSSLLARDIKKLGEIAVEFEDADKQASRMGK
jgi:type VII secretion effector (TIGR04197 family)